MNLSLALILHRPAASCSPISAHTRMLITFYYLASWSSPWAYSVADQMGLKPKLADKGLTIVTVDKARMPLKA